MASKHNAAFLGKALRESDASYRLFFESLPLMHYILRSEAMILSVNSGAAEQLGFQPEQLVGRPVAITLHQDDRRAAQDQIQAALANPGSIARWESRNIRKDVESPEGDSG